MLEFYVPFVSGENCKISSMIIVIITIIIIVVSEFLSSTRSIEIVQGRSNTRSSDSKYSLLAGDQRQPRTSDGHIRFAPTVSH